MQDRYVLEFPVQLEFEAVKKKLRVVDEEDIALAESLYKQAVEIARPKAVYRICYVDGIEGDGVEVSGTTFQSAVMSKKLADIHRVFAYVCTCGAEVDEWSHQESDYFLSLWLDMIKELILEDAIDQFFAYIQKTYEIKKTATMNPGSGNADLWPIAQQFPLFDLIGDVGEVGVWLSEGFLMIPTKSVSGIIFPTDREYVNCALCTRDKCPKRRAAYDPTV